MRATLTSCPHNQRSDLRLGTNGSRLSALGVAPTMSVSSRVLAVAVALVSALLVAAAFPPLGWTVLAFIGWVPLVVAQFASGVTDRFARTLGR